MKKVTVINPVDPGQDEAALRQKQRVCAYCRVSTSQEEQLHSFAAQVSHYTEFINSRPDWEFAGIYADEGISGTSKDKRSEFLRLIRDCEAKRVDMVITKSISRFARNTADCIETVRHLKELGVAVFFEKENINTMSAESELVMTVLSSIAQEESSSISQNIRWGNQRRYSKGIAHKTYPPFGYYYDEKNNLRIHEEQSGIIRRIFDEYVSGKGIAVIARELTAAGIKTPKGGDKWSVSTLREILTNEKYIGDVEMQKSFTADSVTYARKRNTGQMPRYYIHNHHEGIIPKEQFQLVGVLLDQRRREKGYNEQDTDKYQNRYAFSGKIVCGECGCIFRRRVLFTNKSYRAVGWWCYTRIESLREGCSITYIRDVYIKAAFVNMFNKLYCNYERILVPLAADLRRLSERSSDDGSVADIDKQIKEITEQGQVLLKLQSKGYLEPALFTEQNNMLLTKLQNLKDRKKSISDTLLAKDIAVFETEEIIRLLKQRNSIIEEFEDTLFERMVDRIIVKSSIEIVFVLKNGLELTEYVGEEVD